MAAELAALIGCGVGVMVSAAAVGQAESRVLICGWGGQMNNCGV